jgi:hypothetical protein
VVVQSSNTDGACIMVRVFQQLFGSLVRLSPKKLASRRYSSCPFQVLGLNSKEDRAIKYDQVRVAFRELAFKYHPDTSNSDNTDKEFIRIKDAFEAIEEGANGIAIVRDDHSYTDRHDSDEHHCDDSSIRDAKKYNAFQDELNGFLHPSVNPQILHEVASVANNMNPGGLDRGGMWHYANMIRNISPSHLPPLRVEGGVDANNDSGTGNRRRRRRK